MHNAVLPFYPVRRELNGYCLRAGQGETAMCVVVVVAVYRLFLVLQLTRNIPTSVKDNLHELKCLLLLLWDVFCINFVQIDKRLPGMIF